MKIVWLLIFQFCCTFELLGMHPGAHKRPLSPCLQIKNMAQDSNLFESLFNPEILAQDSVCSPRSTIPTPSTIPTTDKTKSKSKKPRLNKDFIITDEQIKEWLSKQDTSLPEHIRLRQVYFYAKIQGGNLSDAEKVKKRAAQLI